MPNHYFMKFLYNSIFIALGIITLCLGIGCTPSKKSPELLRTPYLQGAIADSISIIWRTTSGVECAVQYKLKDEESWSTQAGVITAKGGSILENMVTLKGLKRGWYYDYKVLTDGKEFTSGQNLFFRAPIENADSVFAFYAVGDIGEAVADGGKPDQLAKSIADRQTVYDLGLLLGDIIYPIGEKSGYDKHLFPYFENVFSNVTSWPIPGNHDWGSDIEENYAQQWKLPGNEHYYSFDYGKVHYIGLDTKNGEFYKYEVQKKWLENDLKTAQGKYDWIIVFLHHNGKSCTYKDDYEAVVTMYPLFNEYNVDLVLNGHAHTYERLRPMDGEGQVVDLSQSNDQYINPDGFISITVGSGGKLRGVGTDPTAFTPDPDNCKYPNLVAAYAHTWAFLEINVNGKNLKAQAINTEDGQLVDEFEISKRD